MTFEELSTARYTQRSYDNKPVEDEKIQKILEAGRVAPTAKNNQPQKVYVVQSPAAMDKLRTLTPCHYNAPLAMIICYDKNQQWHNPADESITSGVEDASIVATHMMLQAADLGVHSTWVNMFVPSETQKAFNLPENEVPVLLMMFGYRIMLDGQNVGGVIVKTEGDKGDLHILFVLPKFIAKVSDMPLGTPLKRCILKLGFGKP